ncbi:hypothetical protein [Tepidiforma sp.]|nr:hypothetical protein [Tepidiforma sp.]
MEELLGIEHWTPLAPFSSCSKELPTGMTQSAPPERAGVPTTVTFWSLM